MMKSKSMNKFDKKILNDLKMKPLISRIEDILSANIRRITVETVLFYGNPNRILEIKYYQKDVEVLTCFFQQNIKNF